MAEKRKRETLSDSDDDTYDGGKRNTFVSSMYRENESNDHGRTMVGNENADSEKSFSGYSDYSLKLMVRNNRVSKL